MPPKKSKVADKPTPKQENNTNGSAKKEAAKGEKDEKPKPDKSAKDASKQDTKSQTTDKKRKIEAQSEKPAPKAQRRSARGQKSSLDPVNIINFLLSEEATKICRPKNEQEEPLSIRSYSTVVPMTPFEELLSAVILSRPISHALGQRTIRTVLGSPYNFSSPKAINDAGFDKVHQSLWDAKTQHKAKTAEQISMLGKVIPEKYSNGDKDQQMQKLLKSAGGSVDDLRQELTSGIKGVGKTGVDIFIRRVQGHWAGLYPFIDERTSASLDKLGLPEDPDDLVKLVKENWKKLDTKRLQGKDDTTKQRMAFVMILERAVGADLEAKVDELLEGAGES